MHAASQKSRPAAPGASPAHNPNPPPPPTATRGRPLAPSWPELGRRLQAALGSGSPGERPRVPALSGLALQAGFPGTAPRGNLTRAAGDLWGLVLGLDSAHVLRARNRANLLGARLPLWR